MSDKPTYEDLEKRVQELEKVIAESGLKIPETGISTIPEGISPNHDSNSEKLELANIIDFRAIQFLMDDFYNLTNIGIAILDLNGNVLIATGWQDICTKFHRVNPETSKNCIESDLELSNGVEPGTFRLYRCKNNMWDMATPIMMGDHKVGNLYLGQFLFEDEPLYVDEFRLQAKRHGFGENEYIAALEKVPRWDRQTVDTVMGFYTKLANLISELGYKNFMLSKNVTEKNDLLNSLRESETKYRELAENLNDVLHTVDADGTITYVSPPVKSVFGYTPGELVGKHFAHIIHPEDLDMVRLAFAEVLQGRLYPREYRIRTKSGEYCWIRTSSRPIHEGEQPIGLQGVITDITQYKQAEEALRESEEKYRFLFDNAQVALFRTRISDGKLIEINERFAQMAGYPNIGDCMAEFKVADAWADPNGRDELIRILREKGFVSDYEAKIIRKDGTHIWILFSATIFSEKGFLEGSIVDITERKRAEKELQREKKRFHILVEESPFGVSFLGKDDSYEYINPRFIKIFGYTLEDIPTGRDWFKKAYPNREYRNQVLSTWLNDQKESVVGAPRPRTFKVKCKDGSEKEINFIPVALETKQHLVIYEDVTGQKKMESHLQQSRKMESIGTLAGGIAHDFNNILFPIVCHAEMLLEDVPKDSPMRNNLKEIYTSSLRARDLVKQILTFSRQDDNEIKLIKIQPIIKEALKLIRSTIPTSIEIKQYISTDCGIIKAGPTQIHQIVMNLATNAFHAMEDAAGELKVNLKEIELGEQDVISLDMEPGQYACLTVADTGIGMDKDLTEKIFDPFFTTKELGKGTGMGLSVVHGIVKSAGGSINVYSESGKGTEFRVYLPVVKSSTEKQETQTIEPIQGGIERILLVDDEGAIASTGKQILERLGYQVTSRTSSLEALEAFRANPDKFDMVITDMAMPNMSGDKLASELVKIRPDIPILLCTGFSEKLSEERAASLGIKGFLMKPIVKNDLAKKIRNVLDK